MIHEIHKDRNGRDRIIWYSCDIHNPSLYFKTLSDYNLHREVSHNHDKLGNIRENHLTPDSENEAHISRLSRYF